MNPRLGDWVFIEVVQPSDKSRDEHRGEVQRIDGNTVTIRFPGFLSMMEVDVTISEFRIRKGIWRLKRYLATSECREIP